MYDETIQTGFLFITPNSHMPFTVNKMPDKNRWTNSSFNRLKSTTTTTTKRNNYRHQCGDVAALIADLESDQVRAFLKDRIRCGQSASSDSVDWHN